MAEDNVSDFINTGLANDDAAIVARMRNDPLYVAGGVVGDVPLPLDQGLGEDVQMIQRRLNESKQIIASHADGSPLSETEMAALESNRQALTAEGVQLSPAQQLELAEIERHLEEEKEKEGKKIQSGVFGALGLGGAFAAPGQGFAANGNSTDDTGGEAASDVSNDPRRMAERDIAMGNYDAVISNPNAPDDLKIAAAAQRDSAINMSGAAEQVAGSSAAPVAAQNGAAPAVDIRTVGPEADVAAQQTAFAAENAVLSQEVAPDVELARAQAAARLVFTESKGYGFVTGEELNNVNRIVENNLGSHPTPEQAAAFVEQIKSDPESRKQLAMAAESNNIDVQLPLSQPAPAVAQASVAPQAAVAAAAPVAQPANDPFGKMLAAAGVDLGSLPSLKNFALVGSGADIGLENLSQLNVISSLPKIVEPPAIAPTISRPG